MTSSDMLDKNINERDVSVIIEIDHIYYSQITPLNTKQLDHTQRSILNLSHNPYDQTF